METLLTTRKTIEEFRVEVTDNLYKHIKREVRRSANFVRIANYYEAKLSEARLEGLHLGLSAVIDAVTVEVKEK